MTEHSSGDGPTSAQDPKMMSLFEHLHELRSRIVKAALAIVVLFGILFAFSEHLLNYLKRPLVLALPAGTPALHFTGPLDVFMANIKVSLIFALMLGAPIWIYQLWRFVEPALYQHEKKYALPFVVAATALFFCGISFCFYVMLPMAMHFLIGMGMEIGTPIITINDYVSLLLSLMVVFGVIFETPVVIVLLALVGILDEQMLSQNRRVVFLIILIVSAIVTPPDPISQISLAIPTYVMYEMSIYIVRFVKKSRDKADVAQV